MGGPVPRISLDCKSPRRSADARRQIGIGQQAVHCVGERFRLVFNEEVALGNRLEFLRRQG